MKKLSSCFIRIMTLTLIIAATCISSAFALDVAPPVPMGTPEEFAPVLMGIFGLAAIMIPIVTIICFRIIKKINKDK